MNPEEGGLQSATLQPHSVEVTRNARGEYQWSIKRYFGDGVDAQTFALEMVTDADTWLRRMYLKGQPT